jgi:anti-sigma regulatory factor (Ser/Thr protein kinase)
VRVSCRAEGGALLVEICDRSTPFDPRFAPPPDLASDLAHRRVGGLGLFLVRELADELSYRHDAATGWNALTIIKRAEHHRV